MQSRRKKSCYFWVVLQIDLWCSTHVGAVFDEMSLIITQYIFAELRASSYI